ncbi:MAG: SPOR domain-containing protein [Coxiellaceae bacterium]|nr:SPOR domain-containing protein [Coxiellaceae bacterium]
MKKKNLRLVALLSLSAALSLLTACHRTPSDSTHGNGASGAHSGCSTNPYLMKYGCSIERIQAAAEAGNPDAQYALGYMYYYGIDTVKDKDTAELWIQRAANQGQPLAKKAWTLINTGQTFNDLHQAAAKKVTAAPYTVVPQESADVDQFNVKNQSGSVHNELPGYGKVQNNQSMTTGKREDQLHDSRLAENAKPVIGAAQDKTAAMVAAKTSLEKANQNAGVRLAKNKKGYTLQLLASAKSSDIKNYIAAHHLGSKAESYRTEYEGKSWYMLTYGHYNTEHDARLALQGLPATLQHHQPWVKSMVTIEKEVTLQKIVA